MVSTVINGLHASSHVSTEVGKLVTNVPTWALLIWWTSIIYPPWLGAHLLDQ